MKGIKLIFGTHNSQPIGATEEELEDAYQTSYKPFLTQIYNHPEIQVVLHYCGLLLSWFEERHPEFLMLINDVLRRKQAELLGGGFYEPFLPLIPAPDRTGQIEMLTTLLRRRFGKRPRGGWVAERIWDPSLASTIRNCGMEYTFVDDHHFRSAGFGGADLNRPCVTEDQGKILTVFPITSSVLQMVPGSKPEEVLKRLLALGDDSDEGRVAVLIDEGEKYGRWQKNGKKIYRDGWFEEFFALLAREKGKVDTIVPSNYLHEWTPARKGYFQSTSYEEMMSWVFDLPAQPDSSPTKGAQSQPSSKAEGCGGYFRQFLSRYPESNRLYSKVMYAHLLVNQIRGDRARKKAAREELWRAECHTAFWHGKDGGIYENRLRKASYSALIEAEKITREKGIFKPSTVAVDFDMDGQIEYLYQGQEINCYVHRVGGVVFELDHIKGAWNYLDTFARYREVYHPDNSSAPNDWYCRSAFVDHFFQSNENINSFDRMSYNELGNFIHKSYKVVASDRDRNEVRLVANGRITMKGKRHPLEIRKNYQFRKNSVNVAYTLFNTGDLPLQLNFGSESNFSFEDRSAETFRMSAASSDGKETRVEVDNGKTIVDSTTDIAIQDFKRNVTLTLSASVPFKLWSLPVETLSRTLHGSVRCYQSTCVVPQWQVALTPGETWSVDLALSIGK